MNIVRVFDYDLSSEVRTNIQQLLCTCFAEVNYPTDRTFFKQIPHFRFVAKDSQGRILSQVGLDYRVMNLDGQAIRVLGLIDLCVAPEFRLQGIASEMLSEVDRFSQAKEIDFLILFADDPSLYTKHGFKNYRNPCRWMKVDDERLTTLGVGLEVVKEIMVKEVGRMRWYQAAELDMLGYMY